MRRVARLKVGTPAKPVSVTSSRSALISIALSRKSLPRICAMRAGWSSPVAGNSSVVRSVPSTKRTCREGDRHALDDLGDRAGLGLLRFRNFSRAGVAKKRSRTSAMVPD